jgi:hypothetical protein
VEDKRFYKHNGFDFKRIFGASLHNVQARGLKEGASTISQQLIKNTHLSHEKTFKRKLQEVKLTRILEKRYTKQEILEKFTAIIEVLAEKPNARLDAVFEYEIAKIKSEKPILGYTKTYPKTLRKIEMLYREIKNIKEDDINANIRETFTLYFKSLPNEIYEIDTIQKGSSDYVKSYKITFKHKY